MKSFLRKNNSQNTNVAQKASSHLIQHNKMKNKISMAPFAPVLF